MTDPTPIGAANARLAVTEARALLEAAWNTPVEARYQQLLAWARETLEPVAAAGDADARWLLHSLPAAGDDNIDEDEHLRRYVEEARRLAGAGSTAAMFFLACELHGDHDQAASAESTEWYRRAAELGHAHSQWCYGLNLMNGRGVPVDMPRGLQWIEAAAHAKFEHAIRFMAQARAEGSYGYAVDEAAAAAWWQRLSDRDLICA